MTSDTLLADRYGRRPRTGSRRRLRIGIAAAVLVAVAWAIWAGYQQVQTPVRWSDGTFTALDDGRSQLEFTVSTDPGSGVVCTVRIFNSGLTEVGRRDVHAGPSSQSTFRVTAVVPTFEQGTSGSVRACVRG
jgi:TRAP-type C4-dicarboxylate transport system permease small subunit